MVLDLEINGVTQTDRCISPKIITAQDFDAIPASSTPVASSHFHLVRHKASPTEELLILGGMGLCLL